MSKNYDNWERLVTAVVRRERDKQLALAHSRDPSSISSTSSSSDLSFTSPSQFDHHHLPHVLQESSQFSDLLPLDHPQWKTMLLPDKHGVAFVSASMNFFLDQNTGKNCFLLGATNLDMSSLHGFEHKSHPKSSRFSEMAELIDPMKLNIRARIKTHRLSRETLYAAHVVFGFNEKYAQLQTANSTLTIFYAEPHRYFNKQDHIVHFQLGNAREDGWKEIKLGDFYVDLGGVGEVVVELEATSECGFSGLIIEGIEFRPLQT